MKLWWKAAKKKKKTEKKKGSLSFLEVVEIYRLI
tara:strand:+ start:320 stop:421 length:102 start_codon:yes stop_codon:yes gene_type:complete